MTPLILLGLAITATGWTGILVSLARRSPQLRAVLLHPLRMLHGALTARET